MRATTQNLISRRAIVAAALLAAALLLVPRTGAAALSEPDNVFHGTALADGVPLATGVVTATIKGETEVLASYTLGSSPGLDASRYFLWVPMDAVNPRQAGAARPGETLEISIDGLPAAEAVLGSRGNVTTLDLERCFTLYQEYYTDADGDGYADGSRATACSRPDRGKLAGELLSPALDCRDDDLMVHPGAMEFCNGRDDNCDGTPDDGVCQRIAAAPSAFSFGSTGVGVATAPQTFTLSNAFNPGDSLHLALGSVVIAGADAGHFAIRSDLCTGLSLPPGASCTVAVDFTPASGGPKPDARLVIASNDPVQQPLTVALSGTGNPDADGDGLSHGADNCPNLSNPDQADNDGDGMGDLCDDDDDNDLVLDTVDNCRFAANNGQTDTDGDGMGDLCDDDDDNDLVLDAEDNCPLVANAQRVDTDGDGVEDAQVDTDADGIGDACEVVLADSGQRSGYTATFGEDADYELHPMLLAPAGDGTVSDGNTKLVWQSQDDGAPRDLAAAAAYCAGLVLGGWQDWRLPERKELFSIVDFGRISPTVNPAVFPATAAAPYWAATSVAGVPGTGWSVDFALGLALPRSTSALGRVRCVRTEPEIQDLLEVNPGADGAPDGTVTHRATGLTWQAAEGGIRNWQAALGYCEALTIAGRQDWRLPDARELLSITDGTRSGPAVDAAVFPGVVSGNYWSSTTNAQIAGQALTVSFGSGAASAQPKTGGQRVRCVRGGEGGAIGNADLYLASVEAPSSVVTGQAFIYRFAVGNLGPHTALGVALADTLPAGAVFEPVGSGPNCNAAGEEVTCALGIIEADAEVVVTIHATMAAAAGIQDNRASVTALSNDADSTNNSVVADTTALYRLSVLTGGDGAGSVSGSPAGYGGAAIDCGATCEAGYAATTEVTLTAVPAPSSFFFGWVGGGCSGTGDCVVTVGANVDVTALFTPYRLLANAAGAGAGSVASLPAGDIDCGGVCERVYLAPAAVTLRATAAPGSFFLGWSGACSGTGDCVAAVDTDVAVTATFTPYRLEVSLDGDRGGTVTSVPAGIACGTDCEELYGAPTEVTLAAVPDADAYFSGWSGGGCVGRGACTVSVDRAVSVTATFIVPADLAVDPTAYDFGAFSMGDPAATARFTVKNLGQADLQVGSLAITGEHGGDFQVTLDGCTGISLAFDEACSLQVAFEPLAGGPRSARLTILSNGTADGVLNVPLAGISDADPDGDGLEWGADNCPVTFNPGQEDADRDNVGDLCDNCRFVANPDQADGNGDALGDACGPVNLAATGQATVFSADDDGQVRAGVLWPAPRFVKPDGTVPVKGKVVLDQLTGLMWQRDGNCIARRYPEYGRNVSGAVTWPLALNFVGGVDSGSYPDCESGYQDWRLPNVHELESLVNAGAGQNEAWLATQGFTGTAGTFWSSTSSGSNPAAAYAVRMANGAVQTRLTVEKAGVWMVRDAVQGPAALAATGQGAGRRPGDDGETRSGIAWPSPRLRSLADGTIKDELTGLVWPGEANSPGPAVCQPGVAMNWVRSLAFVRCLNENAYLGWSDWRLPNRRELFSLVHYGVPDRISWLTGEGVRGIIPTSYWTSTTLEANTEKAWVVSFLRGTVNPRDKRGSDSAFFTWPVRGGAVSPP